MNKNIGIILGVVVIIIAGIVYSSTKNEDAMMQKDPMESDVMIKEDGDTMMKDDISTMVDKKDDAMMKVGSYEAYSPEKVARAETGDVVLFFHASWCPSCRALNLDIEKNMSSIPEGVSILKVDYDKETEMKKKYGITYQHTLVQVDKDGNMIKKWSGSPTLSSLVL